MTKPHRARKRFGQNFLHDVVVIENIIALINPHKNDTIVEIGPGKGALTERLISAVQKIIAIELDHDLIPILQKNCGHSEKLIVHQKDALQFDFNSLTESDTKFRLVGNLPYNISTPLLFHLLESAEHIEDMHFMLQKEVVNRITAQKNQSAYGQLSVLIQYHCKASNILSVEPDAFFPKPKVDSAIVKLVPHKTKTYIATDYSKLKYLVKKAFSHPRKTLRNNLKNILNEQQLEKLNVNLSLRPQQLALEDYVALCNNCDNITLA